MIYDPKTMEDAREGRKLLRLVLVTNAGLILVGLLRFFMLLLSNGESLGHFGGVWVWLPLSNNLAMLMFSLPALRGADWARTGLVLTGVGKLLNFFLPWRGVSDINWSTTSVSYLVLTLVLLWALTTHRKTKLYFRLKREGIDLNTNPAEDLIDEIGKE